MKVQAIICLVAVTTAGCAAEGKQTASFTYSPGQDQTLYAYPLEPAPETRDPEKLANRVYGNFLGARSPLVRYFCVWRPTSRTGFVSRDHKTGPWEEIFMACAFGTSAWTPPSNMMEAVNEIQKREEAVLQVIWKWQGKSYVPFCFNVEINNPTRLRFRSANQGDNELSEIHLVSRAMKFPTDREQPLSFSFSAKMPYRLNTGDKAGERKLNRIFSVRIEGMAVPTPKWLNY